MEGHSNVAVHAEEVEEAARRVAEEEQGLAREPSGVEWQVDDHAAVFRGAINAPLLKCEDSGTDTAATRPHTYKRIALLACVVLMIPALVVLLLFGAAQLGWLPVDAGEREALLAFKVPRPPPGGLAKK
jgi:hypothetical protein